MSRAPDPDVLGALPREPRNLELARREPGRRELSRGGLTPHHLSQRRRRHVLLEPVAPGVDFAHAVGLPDQYKPEKR